MERRKRTPITKEIVEKALSLFAANLNAVQVGKLLGISDTMAGRIRQTGSWEALQTYNKAVAILSAERRKKKNEKESEAKEAWEKASKNEQTIEDVVEQLKEINIKLDQLISIQVNAGDERPNYNNQNTYKPY